MKRSLFLAVAMSLSSVTYGACQTGSAEIGDTGPDDSLVCKTLESRYPDAEITIVNREIQSADRIAIDFDVNDRPQRMEYRLTGFEWRLKDPGLLADQ